MPLIALEFLLGPYGYYCLDDEMAHAPRAIIHFEKGWIAADGSFAWANIRLLLIFLLVQFCIAAVYLC